MSESVAWRIIGVLSVISAGAYIGQESASYFWDLTSYVEALDSEFPYRAQRTFPFLYPPFTADVFTLARSHLFELLTIAYVGAWWLLLWAFARLSAPHRFEWLFAITAMGGLGIVSVQSGNLAILMNLATLALALQAATGHLLARQMLPIAIGVGALLKPQFVVYLVLLPFVERSIKAALVKMVAAGIAVVVVYAGYMVFRPFDWNEYVQAIVTRAVVEKDFAWGPAGFIKRFSDTNAAALSAFVAGFLIVAALSYTAWRRSTRAGSIPAAATVSLVYLVATFANPRLPLYDVYSAAIALIVCCSFANRASIMPWVLLAALAVNLVPWSISEFARTPSAFPGWMQDLQIMHMLGIGSLLIALSRVGIQAEPAPD
jgi:hypothetical protein